MPTWLVAESAFKTLLTLAVMNEGGRIDELKALVDPMPTGQQLDRMAAHGWVQMDGEFTSQRRFRITKHGREALHYARAERAHRLSPPLPHP